MEKQFVILYTHQKQKKAKTWHDGTLKHSGSGTKAVLYDDKGCRLDSIHIKVDDIQLGEQLESDRYYILVEEVKTVVQHVPDTTDQTETSRVTLSSQSTFSRARCAGLKRKKSGFMPPRMVKRACEENFQESQSDRYSSIGYPQTCPSDISSDSCYQSESARRVPLLHQIQNVNVPVTEKPPESENLFQKYPAESVGRNLYNMYSRYNKHENDSGSINSSQGSSDIGENKSVLSPWSVYGSKNSSPSLSVRTVRHESVSSQQPFGVGSKNIDADKNFDKFVDKQIEESQIPDYSQSEKTTTKPSVRSDIDSNEKFSGAIIQGKQEKQLTETSRQLMDQSKRNITQIMKLLKKKPDENLENAFTNFEKSEKSLEVTNNSTIKSITMKDDVSSGMCVDKATFECNVTTSKEITLSDEIKGDIQGIETTEDEGKLSNGTLRGFNGVGSNDNDSLIKEDIIQKASAEGSLSVIENYEETGSNEDLIGSFHINFSPLSHVTDSDDENEVMSSNDEEIKHSKPDCDSLQIEKCQEETSISENGNAEVGSKTEFETSKFKLEYFISCKTNISEECLGLKAVENFSNLNNGSRKVDNGIEPPGTNVADSPESAVKEKVKCKVSRFEIINDDHDDIDGNLSESNELIDSSHKHCLDLGGIKTDKNLFTPETVEEESSSKTHSDNFEETSLEKRRDANLQFIDMNNTEVSSADKGARLGGNTDHEVATEVDTELAVDNSESHYSRTTSVSQDTMDFSCDTLDNDSQNYFGIPTERLDKLLPSTCLNCNSLKVDKSDEKDSRNIQYQMNNSKNIQNSNNFAQNLMECNTERQYENEPINETSAATLSEHRKSHQLDKRRASVGMIGRTASTFCPDFEDTEDPLENLNDGVPSLLNVQNKRLAREKQEMDSVKSGEMSEPKRGVRSIDSLLGNYGTQGVSSAVVSRVHHNASKGVTDSSLYKTAYLTDSQSPGPRGQIFNQYQSPFQQLSDSDLSRQSSPSFYIDWQNNKPQIRKADKVSEDQSSSIVFCPDYDYVSNRSSQNSIEKPSSQNLEEEEIYSNLYKQRLTYAPYGQNQSSCKETAHSDTSEYNREFAPTTVPEAHQLSQFNRHFDSPEARHYSFLNSHDSSQYQNFQAVQNDSGACGNPVRQPYLTEPRFHSQFSQSSDEYFLQEQAKVPLSSLESAGKRKRTDFMENEMKHTPEFIGEEKSSKWQSFVGSQTSDDCDIDFNKLTKKVENSRNLQKDFVALKSSPGLYNIQRAFFQSVVDTEQDEKSALQSVINAQRCQMSDFSNGNDLSEQDIDGSSNGSAQLNVTKSRLCSQHNANTKLLTVQGKNTDKGKSNEERISISGTVTEEQEHDLDPDMSSSMDSFEQLLADDSFEIEKVTENVRNMNSETRAAEQQVPEIEDISFRDTKVTGGEHNMKERVDITVADKNEISLDKYDDKAELTKKLSKENDIMNECKRQKINSENEACVPSDNEFSPEIEDLVKDTRELTERVEDSNDLISGALNGVKHLEQADTVQKTCNVPSFREKDDLNQKEISPLFISENAPPSHEFDREKDLKTAGENKNNFPGFSLDESFDLSFSLDSNSVCSPQPEPHIGKTPTMRIGWQPPMKSGSRTSVGLSTGRTETMSQLEDTKSSEKVKPIFKCLRLIAQNKSKVDPEKKTETSNKSTDKESDMESQYLKHESDSGSQQTWKFNSPKQSPNLFQDIEHVNTRQKNLPKGLDGDNDGGIANNKTYQQRLQVWKSPSTASNKCFKPPSLTKVPAGGTAVPSPSLPQRRPAARIIANQQGSGVSQTEFRFPSRSETEKMQTVLRQVIIPETFPTAAVYKQVLTAAITEYVNTQLFDVAKRYHRALSNVDTSGYSEYKSRNSIESVHNPNPKCQCGVPSKMICVRKEGANCGRYFYACSANRKQQCKFFQWADEMRKGVVTSGRKRKIETAQSLRIYMKDQHIHFYGECQLIKRTKENINRYFKAPKWARNRSDGDMVQKKQIFLKLPYKGHSSIYAKDDIWVISKHLDFDPLQSFLARSTYYGPSSSLEVEIEPLTGYSPSNWQHESVCHAILVGNISTELSCVDNIREHIQAQSPPVLPHLLSRQTENTEHVRNASRGFQAPRIVGDQVHSSGRIIHIQSEQMDDLSRQYIERYELNTDQAEAMKRVANMFSIEKSAIVDSVLLIHGVFGAGKSFLLSVMVLFLVEMFQLNDSQSPGEPFPWKLLISSTTNVAVDRILIGLLDLGFEDFVRVGSVKKIAKPVLPFSVHASGTDNQELKDLQEMLRSGELTAAEKSHVRQSIEKHRLGENKKKLGRVRVVGATCASCSLTCLNNMQFPLVLLDECSQMTEPASLLPVAKFGCQKLLLVGDPKQLDPTIQGAEAAHQNGLEQTMFDRLIKMGSVPTLLRTQYRCHPNISAVANKLFYGGMLEDGISETDRKPLLEILPTICYFDVERGEECCEAAGSYYNEREAQFVVFLLQVLLSSGIEPSAVGVITLYKSQMARISDLLTGHGDDMDMKGIQVSTVDAFQGGERDVIILSTVRSQACGFIDNDKRTNVALTRAKHHLFIVGNLNNLSKNVLWGKVINHCKGYKNGIQSADEARHSLEKYLENMQNCETSQGSHGSKPVNSQSSTTSEKTTRKRRPRGKRKLLDSELDIEASSCQTNEGSLSSSNNSSRSKKRFKTSVTSGSNHAVENVIDDDFDDDFIMDGFDTNVSEAENIKKRPISSAGDDGRPAETVDNSGTGIQRRRRHEDRLNSLMFDSDHDNTDEEDLPTFNYN